MPTDQTKDRSTDCGKGDQNRSLVTQDFRDNHDRIFAPKPHECSCGGKAVVKPHTVRSKAYGVQCTRKKCKHYLGYFKTWEEAVKAWNKVYS